MKLRNMPTGSLGRLALYLLALLCVLYALYIAFLMPPLVKYGTAGGRADGRAVCAAVEQRADRRYRDAFHLSGELYDKFTVDSAANEIASKASADCLSETAVNTPLLVFRTTILLIIGAASALLAYRLRA